MQVKLFNPRELLALVKRHITPRILNVKRIFVGFVGYGLALWAIGAYGDATVEVVRSRPAVAAVLFVSVLFVREIWRLASGRLQPISLDGGVGLAAGASASVVSPTERDRHITAVHEAGHALVHAALSALPFNFEAVLGQDKVTGSLVQCFVLFGT